jgi:hypothetical protein
MPFWWPRFCRGDSLSMPCSVRAAFNGCKMVLTIIAATRSVAAGCGLQSGFDSAREIGVIRFDISPKAAEEQAIFAHDKFFKVPLNLSGEILVVGFGQLGKEGVLIITGDGSFCEEREIDGVFGGAKGFDFAVGTGLLGAEVIGGKGQHREALTGVFFLEGDEGFVLGSGPALGGSIDDEQDLAPMVGEGNFFAINVLESLIVDGFGGCCFVGRQMRGHEKQR